MKLLAVYHAGYLDSLGGARQLRRGRHLIRGGGEVSGEVMAAVLGRIRNAAALARELNCGPRPEQIVTAAYRRWGQEYPRYIEGPAATVVIDRSTDTLVASRDRMGERRLFYCRHGRTVALSDHPDALLDTPYAQRIVDAQGLNELFALGPARTPGKTPLRDVMALEPGCCLAADRRGVRVWRYFAPRARPHEDSPEATVQTVRAMLERAVEDIPESADGAMLSGGLDSTALTALLHAKGRPMRTFSVDYQGDLTEFTGNAYQPERDRDYAAMAAELFSREHKNIVLDYQALTGSLGEALDARGFPGMGDIDSSMLLFAREIRRDCAGVVSGEGGDEVFCGYPWFKEENLTLEKGFPWSGSMDLRQALLRRDVEEVLKVQKYADRTFKSALDMVPRVSGEGELDAANRAMQWLCIRFFMSNLQERALCMCESADLEVITPFTDERLVEYLWNVPREMKFMNGEGKGLLREAVKDLLPDTLLHRKKSPYPKVYSKAYTDTLRQSVRAMASDLNSPILQAVDSRVLLQLCQAELPAGGLPWFGQLMSGPQMLAYLWQVNQWLETRRIRISL